MRFQHNSELIHTDRKPNAKKNYRLHRFRFVCMDPCGGGGDKKNNLNKYIFAAFSLT